MIHEMTWQEAIIKVLETYDRVHYLVITDEIVKNGYRENLGLTPARTVNFYLNNSSLKDKVVRVSKGEFILKSKLKKNPSLASDTSAIIPKDSDDDDELDDALITSYGRFWSRSLWETNKFRLFGTSAKTSNAPGMDFADLPGIYLLHKGHDVIYVGQASKLIDRLIAHTKDDKRNRWDNFSWFCIADTDKKEGEENIGIETIRSIKIGDLLDTLEALLIETLGPERNKKVGNGFENKEFEQIDELTYVRSKYVH